MADFLTRAPRADDIASIGRIVEDAGLFPGEMIPGMLAPFLQGDAAALWVVIEDAGGQVAGVKYSVPEEMTDGTWNMLAIGVSPDQQGHGFGRALVAATEQALRQKAQRLLIVDTSGTDAFEGARAFYARLGYEEVACIRDFWADGDDKITFRKAL